MKVAQAVSVSRSDQDFEKGRFIAMNKKIILSSILVVLFCLFFTPSALAHGKVAALGHSAAPSGSPPICIDVSDVNNGWFLPQPVCDGSLIAAPNGINGIAVSVKGRDIHYSGFVNGAWLPEEKNGNKLGNGGKAWTAIRISIGDRVNGGSVSYLVVDGNFTIFTGRNDQPAGSTAANAAPLNLIQVLFKS
jgi:hypothetical protein